MIETAPVGWNEIVAYYTLPTRGPDGMVLPSWRATNLVTLPLPFALHLSWADIQVTHATCHKKIVDPLLAALHAVLSEGYAPFLSQDYGGCYMDRAIRGAADHLSMHAFGAALDFRVKEDPMGDNQPEPEMAEVAKIFKSFGWFWGGDFMSRKDPEHFQWASGY